MKARRVSAARRSVSSIACCCACRTRVCAISIRRPRVANDSRLLTIAPSIACVIELPEAPMLIVGLTGKLSCQSSATLVPRSA